MKTMYVIKAIMKDGSEEFHDGYSRNINEALDFAHHLLSEYEEIDYCVPFFVTMKDTDIEIRRKK